MVIISGTELDSLVRLVAGVLLLLIVFVGLRTSPKLAMIAWILTVCFIPVWIGVNAYAFLSANIIISLLTAVSLFPLRIRWSVIDLVFGTVLIFMVIEAATRSTTRGAIFDVFAIWLPAFLLGRIIVQVVDPRWIYRAFAICFTIVAVLALFEFLTASNLFINHLANNTRSFDVWGGLQPRGGVLRAEGSFGHAIALGSSLGIAVAFTMGADFRTWLKVSMVGVMAAAAVVTFSRTGMVTAGLAIVLACVFQRQGIKPVFRTIMLSLTAIGGLFAFGFVRDVFANSDEAEGSALYRSDLLELIRYMRPLGLASNYGVSTTQDVSIGSFASIDNAALLFGLIYGWLPLVLLGVAMLAGLIAMVRRRCTPAVIAIVAQLPAFVTVALITQYASLVWFAAGLAVSTQLAVNVARSAKRLAPDHAVTPLTLNALAKPLVREARPL